MSFRIAGTGRGIPKLTVDNNRLSELVETSDEWISSRTGISERHILTDETLNDLCAAASEQALRNAGIRTEEIDYIICSTANGDYMTPSQACMIQKSIGAACPAFDINAACTGFIYALEIAAGMFDSGRAENILVVSAEAMSRYADWTDRKTCVLFGDGAGAVVLTKGDGLMASKLTAQGNVEFLNIPSRYSKTPFSDNESTGGNVYMNGQEVFKFAVSSLCHDAEYVLERAGLTMDDIAMVVSHQANSRIIDAAKKRLGVDDSKMPCNISRYGNTSSASIPILLSELVEKGNVKKGDFMLFAAFGGGFTSGAAIIRL